MDHVNCSFEVTVFCVLKETTCDISVTCAVRAGKAVNSNFPKSTYTHTATKLENDVRNCGRQVVWRRGQSCPVTKLRCSHVCSFVLRVSEADNLEQSGFL